MDNILLRKFRFNSTPAISNRHALLACLTTIFLVVFFVSEACAQATSSDVVKQVVSLYFEGKFKDAEFTALRALQYPGELASVDRAELHRILGFTYVAQGENEKARRQFISWLELDSLASLDPLYISPKIREVFNDAREEYKRLKTQKTPLDYKNINLKIEAVKRSLLFPGLGQLYRGQQFKGFSLLASEVVLLSTFLYCQVNYSQSRDLYLSETDPAHMQKLYDDYNLYNKGRYASAILAVGVYLFSLYDALYIPPKSEATNSAFNLSISPNSSRLVTLRVILPDF